MANVNDKVTQIRQAVLGKDVRENIASGIEVINEEVINTTARQDAVDINEQSRIAAEDIRQSREDYRQNTFETNEADRQSEFDANETDRINNYNTNEAIRDTNEVTRQTTFTTNEATRQSAFDTAETNRADQYNTNEAARDANEVARQSEFDTNENTRTNQYNTNEATRNTNEINRQSTFDTNETNRTNTFNTNEQARIDAENIRETNETNRVDSFASMESRFDAMEHLDAGFEIVEARGTKASINERFVDIEDDIVNINTTVGNQVSFVSTPEGEPEPVQEITEYNFIDHIADLETEVQGARNGEINLNDRLDGFDTSLSDRVQGKGKIYTNSNISELGLTLPCTCSQLATALPNNSIVILTADIASTISDSPYAYGKIFIEKIDSNRVSFIFKEARADSNNVTTNSMYIASYRDASTTKFSGWKQVATTDVLPNQNVIVNGDFQVWQRGTSFALGSSISYSADRWVKSRTFQSIAKTSYGLQVTISGATSNGAGIIQPIEVQNTNSLIGQALTLSLKYRSTVALKARIVSSDYVTTFASVTDSLKDNAWRIMSCTGTITAITNNILRVEISCPNIEDGTFEVAWVKLEVDSVATPFYPRAYAEELLYCQRYYQKAAVPNQVILTDSAQASICVPLKVTMRTTPSLASTPTIYLHPSSGGTALDFGGSVGAVQNYSDSIMLESTLATISSNTLYGVNQSSTTANNSSGLASVTFDAEIY